MVWKSGAIFHQTTGFAYPPVIKHSNGRSTISLYPLFIDWLSRENRFLYGISPCHVWLPEGFQKVFLTWILILGCNHQAAYGCIDCPQSGWCRSPPGDSAWPARTVPWKFHVMDWVQIDILEHGSRIAFFVETVVWSLICKKYQHLKFAMVECFIAAGGPDGQFMTIWYNLSCKTCMFHSTDADAAPPLKSINHGHSTGNDPQRNRNWKIIIAPVCQERPRIFSDLSRNSGSIYHPDYVE